MSRHSDLASNRCHVPGFYQSTDPSLDADNRVTAGKFWIDTTSSPFKLKVRNATNDGWNEIILPTTTKGDLVVHNGTTNVALPVSVTDGDVLKVNSATATGLEWGVGGGGGGGAGLVGQTTAGSTTLANAGTITDGQLAVGRVTLPAGETTTITITGATHIYSVAYATVDNNMGLVYLTSGQVFPLTASSFTMNNNDDASVDALLTVAYD